MDTKKGHGSSCAVKYCNNKSRTSVGISYFTMPKNIDRRSKWIESCLPEYIDKNVFVQNLRICSEHFEDKMFLNVNKKNRLTDFAVPTLFSDEILAKRESESDLTMNEAHDLSTPMACSSPISCTSTSLSLNNTSDSSSQTLDHLSYSTPRKVVLRTALKEANEKIKSLEKTVATLSNVLAESDSIDIFLKQCQKYLPPALLLFVKSYFMCKSRKKSGYRYSKSLKQFALTIYFLGPRVYNFMKSILSLPSTSTLKRATSKFEMQPGFNDFLFSFINFKTKNYSAEAVQCILCADEMSIKSHLYYLIKKDEIMGFNTTNFRKTYEPAKYALVLMLRGINVNWKLPIAYYLISSTCTGYDLQDIIFSTLIRLQNTPLDVKAFITDMGSNFVGLSSNLNITPSRPYFEINNKKIFYIFDPPHLLISTRNMFLKHSFKVDENIIDKKYLVSFYKEDSNCNLRLAPKLTNQHIYPNTFQKMRVYLAAQLFSATVGAAMETYLTLNKLSFDSRPTIEFIKNIDKLFDIFNSYKRPHSKDYNRPFINSQLQKSHLLLMNNFFTSLIVLDKNNKNVTNRMKFIRGWLVSIASLTLLWQSLSSINPRQNYVLFTNRINQDCLEYLFCTFRQKQGNNFNPTPVQFYYSFKNIFCLNYFKHSDNANCLQDFDVILSEISDPTNTEVQNIMFPDKTPFKFKTSIPVASVDYRDLELPEQNILTYICGYLIKKCLETHACNICINYAKFQKNVEPSFLFSYFKAYENSEKSTFGNLMMPHSEFYNYINSLETVFINRFPILAPENKVGEKLKLAMLSIYFSHPCESFNKDYLLNLFIRFRIFSSVKFLNKELVSEKVKKNKKIATLKHL